LMLYHYSTMVRVMVIVIKITTTMVDLFNNMYYPGNTIPV
jgi:hypothetical protein